MAFLIAVLLSFIPAFFYAAIVYWLDRFEKEPRRLLLGAFSWGAVVATLGALVWTSVLEYSVQALTRDAALAELTGTALLAPLVEESLKGIAIVIIFLAVPYEFDSVLDGIVYGAITALGFAATENVLYLYFSGYQEGDYGAMMTLFVLRVVLGGWGHAVYTAWTGIGLAVARLRQGWAVKLGAPFLGWCVAVFLHATHNGMAALLGESLGVAGLGATLIVDWMGWLVALGMIIWALLRERSWMITYLREEVEHGIINAAQYRTACSIRGQLGARMRGQKIRHFYQTCAELAQKKHQLITVGDEGGNSIRIAQLRAELGQLATAVSV